MWTGVLPAVTSKFKANGALDHDEMTRCFVRGAIAKRPAVPA